MVELFGYKLEKSNKDTDASPEGFTLSQLREDGFLPDPSHRQTSATYSERRRDGSFSTGHKTVGYDQLEALYRNYPIVYRGINIRANEIVAKGFKLKLVKGDQTKGEKALALLDEFVDRTGLRKQKTHQLCINTDIAGYGPLEVYRSEEGKWQAELIAPNAIDYERNGDGSIKLDLKKDSPTYGEPVGMVFYPDPANKASKKEIKRERIALLIFNKLGGEFLGMSTLQPIYKEIERIMNIEEGYAEAAFRAGFGRQIIEYGQEGMTPTAEQRRRAREIAQQIATQDVIILPTGRYKIEQQQTQSVDPSILNNYFLNLVVSCIGLPKYQLIGSTQGEGNRAVASVQDRKASLLIEMLQLAVSDCYENQIFRRILDAEGYEDVVVEMEWDPLIEEDEEFRMRVQKQSLENAKLALEMGLPVSWDSELDRATIQDGQMTKAAAPASPFGGTPFQNFQNSSMQLAELTEEKKAERNRVANADFDEVQNGVEQLKNTLQQFHQDLKKYVLAKFTETGAVLSSVAPSQFEKKLAVDLARIYTTGFNQAARRVDLKQKKKLQDEDVDESILALVLNYARTIGLRESGDLVNAVNTQIAIGLSAGEGNDQIRRRIEDVFVKFQGSTGRFTNLKNRAELIARAETARIVNSARVDAYAQAGVKKYEWLAIIDNRTDQECAELNGQIFEVGKGPLPVSGTHPNCRCTVVPVV